MTLDVSVKCRNRGYGQAFLELLMEKEKTEWLDIQRMGVRSASEKLNVEIERIKVDIKNAETDLIEYRMRTESFAANALHHLLCVGSQAAKSFRGPTSRD